MQRRTKVSRVDIKYIKIMAARGMSANEIGGQLGIVSERCAQFMPKPEPPKAVADPPPPAKTKAKKKK